MKTRKQQDIQWDEYIESYDLNAHEHIEKILGSCYLNLYLVANGMYNKTFLTMTDGDYPEYVAVLEKVLANKHKIQ
jgi:hypothetical protein